MYFQLISDGLSFGKGNFGNTINKSSKRQILEVGFGFVTSY